MHLIRTEQIQTTLEAPAGDDGSFSGTVTDMMHESGVQEIGFLEPSEASNAELVNQLVEIVNSAYADAERGMWIAGAVRVTADEMRHLIRSSEIIAARVDERPVGCVRLRRLDETAWGFGMLAAAHHARGTGVGRSLVGSAEEAARQAGASEMQLELLVPIDGTQESKSLLADWYSRAGYRNMVSKPLSEDYPALIDSLAVACDYQVWRKPLP